MQLSCSLAIRSERSSGGWEQGGRNLFANVETTVFLVKTSLRAARSVKGGKLERREAYAAS